MIGQEGWQRSKIELHRVDKDRLVISTLEIDRTVEAGLRFIDHCRSLGWARVVSQRVAHRLRSGAIVVDFNNRMYGKPQLQRLTVMRLLQSADQIRMIRAQIGIDQIELLVGEEFQRDPQYRQLWSPVRKQY